ncbi:hypothetical protein [Rhodopirellula sp. SWK7]|uniref:hypothetical protein n=1 Tax=Rhodopirellula sp. SWK7 TaxID=595460 RepID=UPI001181C2A1|nr:hypothetical protein [Rhodopirellula sp. SWK7]
MSFSETLLPFCFLELGVYQNSAHRLVTVVTEAMETLIRQDSRTRQPVSCLNADLFRRRFW